MTTKHFIAAAILLIALLGGAGLACISRRIRDLFFFLIVVGQVYFDRMDVNFFTAEWYRGTTRGVEISVLDSLAVALLIGSLVGSRHRPRFYWPASLGFMLFFLCFEGLSVATSQPQMFGIFEATKMVRAIIVFLAVALYVRGERELRLLLLGLGCAVCLEGLYAVKQRFLGGIDRSPGTYDSANSLSLYLCTVGPVLVAGFNARFPKWLRYFLLLAIGAACVTILLTISRAGIPVFGLVMLGTAVMTTSWEISLKKIAAVLAIFFGILAPLIFTWDAIKARYADTSMQEELAYNEYENRGQYVGLAKEILKDRSMGVGLNNWSYWVSKTYGPRTGVHYEDYDAIPSAILESPEAYDINPNYAPPAHNLFVLTVGEMGWTGLAVFLLLWLRWFRMGLRFFWVRSAEPELRMGTGLLFALGGMFLQSQTEWVYRQTTIMFTFYVLLGTLASLSYLKWRARREAAAVYATKQATAPYFGPGRQQPAS